MHQHVKIKGIKNIITSGLVNIGIRYVGFVHKKDRTQLNIRGKLRFKGNFSIGRGCRFDIGKEADVTIGKDGYINSNTYLIIMNHLEIGDDCAISWNCHILDEDFHTIQYSGKIDEDKSIIIGNHVWVGCGSKIYKGTVIPDGCIIASDSLVKGIFTKKNCLIGGHPAKVLKENVEWNW